MSLCKTIGCATVLVLLAPSVAGAALCGDKPNLLVVLDKSGSMSGTKWSDAKSAISQMVSTYGSKMRFGLMYFSGSCSVSVSVAVGDNTYSAIMSSLNSNSATGGTEIAGAINAARTYLKGIYSGKPKFVVLITDGVSSTGCGDPTTAVRNLRSDGVDTFVVGFGTGVSPTQLTAMAQAGGTTSYYQASNYSSLNSALSAIATQVDCCGNGVLDSGEICDTTISSGTGACPTAASCQDTDACTKDGISGTLCAQQCSNTRITAALDGDGCCPSGATSLTDNDCQVVCGNGLMEVGELCDPGITSGAGACPTPSSCDDKDVCSLDGVTGSGCKVMCSNTPLSASLAAMDGCCPGGATSLTDADCATSCGNGLLEAGETCDPGITAGPGKCPVLADCDDKDACTTDVLGGGACTLACSHGTVGPSATSFDSCCPKGANAVTDVDCPASCGNGVLEKGENCDTGITSGPGKCPTKAECDDKDVCTQDIVYGNGCSQRCLNSTLPPDPTTKDGCCPKGNTLRTDADCLPPCSPDRTTNCIELCKDVQCPAGSYCDQGKCVSWGKDGGTQPAGDAGAEPEVDSGFFSEAGIWVGRDAGNVRYTEAGVPIPADDEGFFTMDGCNCQTASPGPLPGVLLLGLLALLRRRRR